MPKENETKAWYQLLSTRYKDYLQASFYFKDKALRNSFAKALWNSLLRDELVKGPFPRPGKDFSHSLNAQELAAEFFTSAEELKPALRNGQLYTHQEEAIRRSYEGENPNIVVATGTASGKTESFLYPILFELFQQYQAGGLDEPGVRALILYPMNALANDQRERLGKICQDLQEAGSGFIPTFGQYTGETPEDEHDYRRNADQREKERQPGELVFRSEMRKNPPHILLTNYSMLEYLLIRPQDSALFDSGGGRFWQFIVLDEAHQYRGTKGMEMAMLIRRLKQRIREGGRGELPFHCIATSATITSEEDGKNKEKVADFAGNLFGEKFDTDNVIFGKEKASSPDTPTSYHTFMRALEGAFLIYENDKDKIVFNRKKSSGINGGEHPEPLEIALCRECGQHYYAGSEKDGKLHEAVRDPSDAEFGVSYYLPIKGIEGQRYTHYLCKFCGKISSRQLHCHPDAIIEVCQCKNHGEYKDQLIKCEVCGYQRGSMGDPVNEIVHGSDGPNAVIATVLHEKQCQNVDEKSSRVLAFADSRQEASFFAWYAENSFNKIRDRNFIWRALNEAVVDDEGLSVGDLQSRLQRICEENNLFSNVSSTPESKKRQILKIIYSELLTNEKRISLQGAGLVQWRFKIPPDFEIPEEFGKPPWNKLPGNEAKELIQELLLDACSCGAAKLIDEPGRPNWGDLGLYSKKPKGFVGGAYGTQDANAWTFPNRSVIKHYLRRVLINLSITNGENLTKAAQDLMEGIWDACTSGDNPLLVPANNRNDSHLLDLRWLRVLPKRKETSLYQCNICARVYFRDIGKVCSRNNCPGELSLYRDEGIKSNHYATLYKNKNFPAVLSSEEHTAQLKSEEARKRQGKFKEGKINLLSSSTTFEVGVDLGDLEVVFMRNVPPESFNYTQRAGRAGRRETPGFVLTYCKRNPHDLYHYEDPEEHILRGKIRPPILKLQNEKIILRHVVAVALSFFFRKYEIQFKNVESFVEDWDTPTAAKYFYAFCNENVDCLLAGLKKIVPPDMYDKVGLADGREWIEKIAGSGSRFAEAEKEVCADYRLLRELEDRETKAQRYSQAEKIKRRRATIKKEPIIGFLSRKAIIPKYGFPVDVVELDTWGNAKGVILQRDLSQAIAEYAPSGKVVVNKKEWESVGIKKVAGQEPLIYYCQIDDNSRSIAWSPEKSAGAKKCIIPKFGFVTRFSDKEKEPRGRARRLFTTRHYFAGFVDNQNPRDKSFSRVKVKVSQAMPGTMVVLCKGKNGEGFYICQSCYAGFVKMAGKHSAPNGKACGGTLESSFLAHEFVTDVVRLQFGSLLIDPWEAYSLAYALLLGAAQTLQLPAGDLNVTITGGDTHNNYAIILYDDVPGGAGLVASLYQEDILKETLSNARQRMLGGCGCDSSCYGCLRSYRNQFAHPYLDRNSALHLLNGVLPK